MGDLSRIRELVFEGNNKHCFIERDRILAALAVEMRDYNADDRYAIIFSKLLDSVSTPVLDCDYFAGRVVEDLPDEGIAAANGLLGASGHMSPDYARVVKIGLFGILDDVMAVAANGDDDQKQFAHNARIVVEAIRRYCLRYSEAAREKGFDRMADALMRVPFEPAYDFYSALQGIWMIHMIASCYVGARDYAFGRFDDYMLPFYEKALADGESEDELTELLAGFLIKCNEICGTATWNYKQKPIRSQASKQYINIGGEHPNAFSSVVLKAAELSSMAQPEITVLLKPDADKAFTDSVFASMVRLTDKLQVYNYDTVLAELLKKGIPEDVAKDFTYSACSTFDLNYHSFRREYFIPSPGIFLDVMKKQSYESTEELLCAFSEALHVDMQALANKRQKSADKRSMQKIFVLDSLLLTDSAKKCRYPADGESDYNVLNMFFTGIATIGDSLMVLDKLVFKEKRYTYAQFLSILQNDYRGYEELRAEILEYVRFGNDSDSDRYAAMVGNAFIDAVDRLELKKNFYAAPGFYSLERENRWASSTGATPDGRLSGTPYSENQSPTYGADKKGVTALLKSLSRLPFPRTVTGALNLSFAGNISADTLKALVVSYFGMGGLHVGISIVDRDTLKQAMKEPGKYRSLTVRLYGFSEYFVNMPEWQQRAILNRTAH